MIINERQVLDLIGWAQEFLSALKYHPENEKYLEPITQITLLLNTISNQQSEKLREIE